MIKYTMGINTKAVGSLDEAAREAKKGSLILIAPDALSQSAAGVEAHDAHHIFSRMRTE